MQKQVFPFRKSSEIIKKLFQFTDKSNNYEIYLIF